MIDRWKISRDDGAVLGELLRQPLKPIEISDICSSPDVVALSSLSQGMKTPRARSRGVCAARERAFS